MADPVDDFEGRLTEALAAGAQAGPAAVGLADAARGRARARRRTRLSTLGAALAIAVVVPVGMLVADAADRPDPTLPGEEATTGTDPATPEPGIPTGLRVESWHGVSVEVPGTWGHGSLPTWCADGGDLDEAVVERPGVTLLIACTPGHGYGMSFAEAEPGELGRAPRQVSGGSRYPDGAWVGSTIVGDVRVLVVSQSENTTRYVVGSARTSGPLDPNGCPSEPGQPTDGAASRMSVCHYDASGRLELSEVLSTADTEAARKAIEASPIDTTQARCDHASEPFGVAELRFGPELATVTFASTCVGDNKMVWRGEPHRVTADVMYWVLSPAWTGGAVGPGVTLPPDRRSG